MIIICDLEFYLTTACFWWVILWTFNSDFRAAMYETYGPSANAFTWRTPQENSLATMTGIHLDQDNPVLGCRDCRPNLYGYSNSSGNFRGYGICSPLRLIFLDLLCGPPPSRSRPSGVISLPWNYEDHSDILDCYYIIYASEPSLISLTIWSISLQSLLGANCQRDWLLVSFCKPFSCAVRS